MIEIIPIDTPTLGDRSHVVTDGEVAFVVDPQRDIDRMLEPATARGVTITHVLETHIHNDYVTGGLALARQVGAEYGVSAAEQVSFARLPVADGDVIEVGDRMRVRALATPGHTFTHLSYALEGEGVPPAVFTGGSLLYGSTGRPDLLGPEHTGHLARAQYGSARRLAVELPDETGVFPTHGFGGFCSASKADASSSTIGRERRVNPVLTRHEEEYVRSLLDGLEDDHPAYYAYMGPANRQGPDAPDLSKPCLAAPAGPAELRRRIEAGEWVVDLRPRTAFAAGHVGGTINLGLDGGLATYLGWLIPWGTPLSLLGATPEDLARAQRELVRIGIDRPAAAAIGGPADWAGGESLRAFPVARFADLAAVRTHRPVVVLDVRRDREWAESHIEGAVHIPLPALLARTGELPDGEVWVHCATGYRASIAASLLDAAGRRVVTIDDEYAAPAESGLPLAT